MAVTVNQAHKIQKEMNQPGCSRGFRVDCKSVDPKTINSSAVVRTKTITLRRVPASRISPRVACTAKEAVCKGFSSGELLVTIESVCQRGGARYLSILQSRNFKSNMSTKSSAPATITPERLMQMGSSYGPPLVIGAAASNKVFDTLAGGPKTVEEVSKQTGASVRGLRAIMNALVGLELLSKKDGNYSLTPESEAFLVSNKPGTLAGLFPLMMKRSIPLWLKLDEIVRTGRPGEARNQEQAGTEFFSELVENIIPLSYAAAQGLSDALKVADAKDEIRVLDLAAGSGIWGIVFAQKSRRVQVTAVDWSGMIPTTKRITQKFGVADRFQYVEGDLLKVDFGKDHDVAILGHILHSEGEERSRQLLKKTFARSSPAAPSPSLNGS